VTSRAIQRRRLDKLRAGVLLLAAVWVGSALCSEESALRVCADPNNLPFSNRAQQGFENRIAELLALDLQKPLQYTWWAQRRGYARNTVAADACDVWIGIASGVQALDTTVPYYRSGYVFVSRLERDLDIRSFDDARLHTLTIGVQMIGNDASNTPPAHALARRGIVDNVRGYMVYGDYERSDPAAPIVDAVVRGEVDVAIVWGPVAGYYAKRAPTPLRIEFAPTDDGSQWPMAFDIAAGVRRGAPELKRELEQAIGRNREPIERVLAEFGVPLLPLRSETAEVPVTKD